jgi:hypothetical protein
MAHTAQVIIWSQRGNEIVMAVKKAITSKKTPTPSSTRAIDHRKLGIHEFADEEGSKA